MIDPIFITLGPYVGVAACVVPLVAAGLVVVETVVWVGRRLVRHAMAQRVIWVVRTK